MKYILEGMNCHTCIADLQAHKKHVKGLLKIKRINDRVLLETDDSVDGKEILNRILEHLEHIGHNHEDVKIYENKTIFLEGLTCANCTAKIEEATKKIPGVKDAGFDFATEKYTLVYDEDYKFENIYRNIEEIVNRIEPEVAVSMTRDLHSHEEEEGFSKLNIAKFLSVFAVLVFLHFAEINEKIALIVYIAAYIAVGKGVVATALRNIKAGDFLDENFLMTLASFGAFAIGQYPEAVAVMLLYNIGEMFEDIALERSRDSISSALALKPQYANVYRDGNIVQVEPEEVEKGEIISVKPGEKVPLDGIIVEGESFVNTANITGESVPRRMTVNDEILSGYVNNSGLLKVKVLREYDSGTVAKILDLVENASARKAPVEKFITRFAKVYTPAVVGFAVFMAAVLPMLKVLTFKEALFRACTFLVISCPCALVISVPLGVFSGIGLASKNGIFVKGGNYLEGLSFTADIVFDKTGTVTKGVFEVTGIYPSEGYSEEEVLRYAALGELNSSHPIGRAVLKKYTKDINPDDIKNAEEISGHGILYETEGKRILVGNGKLLDRYGVKFSEREDIKATKVLVAADETFIGEISVSDVLKDNIREDLEKLKKRKIKLTMLSGDNTETALNIGKKAGIDNIYGNLLPDGKVEKLEEIMEKSSGKTVFVGDGVNDAPVIARADIGIAMGALGSDSAVEAADIVLMTDEIGKISDAIDISEYTKKVVWQNIVFALGVKIFVLVLGALGYASMWAAVFADVGVTLIAILNSVKILRYKLK